MILPVRHPLAHHGLNSSLTLVGLHLDSTLLSCAERRQRNAKRYRRRSGCRVTAAAAAGEPVRTGRQVNTSTERTEESRGGLPRRLGDPVREPAPGTVATGSRGGRDSETGKGEGRGKRGIPASLQPDGGRHGGWVEALARRTEPGTARGRARPRDGQGAAWPRLGGGGGGALLWPGRRAPPPPRKAALETGHG